MMKQSDLSLVMMNLITLKTKGIIRKIDGEKTLNIMNLKLSKLIGLIIMVFFFSWNTEVSAFWAYDQIINNVDASNLLLIENKIDINAHTLARHRNITVELCISNKSPNTNYFKVYASTITSRSNKKNFLYPNSVAIDYWDSLEEKINIYTAFNLRAGFGEGFFSRARYINKSYRKSWKEKPYKIDRIKQTEKSLNNVRNGPIRILPYKAISVTYYYYLLNKKSSFLRFGPSPEDNEFIFKSGNIYNKYGLNHPFIREFVYYDKTK